MADVKQVDTEARYPQAEYSEDVRRLVVRLTELHRQYVQKLVELEKRIKELEP